MEVEVEDALARLVTDVGHHPVAVQTQPLGLLYATCRKDSKLELSNLTLTICSNVTIINLNQQLMS